LSTIVSIKFENSIIQFVVNTLTTRGHLID